MDKTQAAIEALLFTSTEAISVNKLSEILDLEIPKIKEALKALQENLEGSGICLKEIAGGWRLFSNEEFHDLITKYVLSLDTRKLSAQALETLSIIAYSQPCTRAKVAEARGVNSDSSINSLIEKGLVREAGTADLPGNPILYATTSVFLEHFGLASIKDLPKLDDFAPDDETKEFIRERLSATHVEQKPEEKSLFDSEDLELDTDDE